uniref:Uncharacterized protein n=1 Tax=Arundo donax TaxID=35708 RepID=A0A0A9E5A5_ARUDO
MFPAQCSCANNSGMPKACIPYPRSRSCLAPVCARSRLQARIVPGSHCSPAGSRNRAMATNNSCAWGAPIRRDHPLHEEGDGGRTITALQPGPHTGSSLPRTQRPPRHYSVHTGSGTGHLSLSLSLSLSHTHTHTEKRAKGEGEKSAQEPRPRPPSPAPPPTC